MSKTFPTTPYDLINAIEQDAPAVYEILMKEYHSIPRDDRYPTREELTFELENYSGNDYGTHYWNGRWSIIQELIKKNDPDDTIGRDNTARFLNDMTSIHYGYHLIRCEVCDQPHRLFNDKEYSREIIPGVSIACSDCGQHIHEDHPDLFY